MKVWLIIGALLLGFAAPQQVLEDCVEVSADLGAELPVSAGLDSALSLTVNFPFATFCLVPSEVPFSVTTSAVVESQTTIQGNGQIISFLKTLIVRGSLKIFNSTLTTNVTSTEFSALALAGGSLHIENSSVDAISAILATGTGSLIFKGSNFTNNGAPAVSIDYQGDLAVRILQCKIWNHTGEFLGVTALFTFGNVSVDIEQTMFWENKGSGFLIACSVPLLQGHFIVSETEFRSNTIPLFSFDIGNLEVSIVRCKFTDNNQTTITVNANGAVFTLEDSLWSGNSHIAVDCRQFTGDLFASRITVSNQRWKGMFQIKNNLAAEECRFTVQDSSFLDIYFKVNEPSPGLIYTFACIVQLTRTVINNVRLAAVHQRDLEALINLRFGYLVVSQLTLHNSGSVSLGIGVSFGNFTITDSFIDDLQSGGGLSLFSFVGNINVQNVEITQCSLFPLDEPNIGVASFYIAVLSSNVKVKNFRVLPAERYYRDNIIFAVFSTIDVSEMIMYGQRAASMMYLIDAKGRIQNITVLHCVFDYSVFYLNNDDFVQISGVTVSESFVGLENNKGFFAGTPKLNVECSDLSINTVTGIYLAASKQAKIHLKNVSISDSHFEYFLKNQLDSNIYIESMTVRRSTAVLAFLYRSSLQIVDSVFEDIDSKSVIFGGENVNLTLDRVIIKNASSPSGFSRFREKSQLTILHCSFSHYRSAFDEAFYQNTGILSITYSSFLSFNTVFIQAKSCSVYIGNSVFQEGRSKALSRTSASAYGGALACIDCPSVIVKHSSFLNISATFGGAIAVRTSSNLTSSLIHIHNCEFVMCVATAGGAVYVKESSCYIEESKFIGNKAVSTGGATDISTSTEHITAIRDCMFYRNSAYEGGAVKWSNAEVRLINVSFQDNSAIYGPDIASYGIKLSGNVTSSSGVEASGYPLQLVFEFQDHYGQRVATATAKDLQLSRNDQVNFLGNVATTIDHGIFNFSQLTIYAQPNSSQVISGTMTTSLNGEITTINASVTINFRECMPGEVRKVDRCEYCFAGKVSLFPTDSNCSFCPKHAFCSGGNALLVDSGYWRNSTNSTDVVLCPLSANCLGGQSSECAEGYTGKVCNECSEDYTRHRTLECEPCSSPILQWAKISLVAIPIVGFHLAVKAASDIQLFILKNIINHAQLLSSLCYLRVSYPTVIKYSLHSLSYISSLYITDLPISCFTSRQSEYIKAIIGVVTPSVFYMILVLLNFRNMKSALVACTSAMMFAPLISLSTQLPLLACQSVQSEEMYLFVDMQHKCWQGDHLLLVRTLMFPSVIINVLLPIALISATSIISPQRFDNVFPLWRSGVKWRWWDLLLYCAKVVLISLAVVSIATGQLCQVTYCIAIMIVVSVVVVSIWSYSYTHWKLFFIAELSLMIVAVSMGLCAFFIYHSSTDDMTSWVVTGVFLVLNAGYFAVCIRLWRHPPNSKVEEVIQVSSPCDIPPPHNSIIDIRLNSQVHT